MRAERSRTSIGVIEGIAFQPNILALNAAVASFKVS